MLHVDPCRLQHAHNQRQPLNVQDVLIDDFGLGPAFGVNIRAYLLDLQDVSVTV